MSDEEFEDEFYDLTDDESVASDSEDELSIDEDVEILEKTMDLDNQTDTDEDEEKPQSRSEQREVQKQRKAVFEQRCSEESDKLPRTLFVGNLPLSATRKSLTKLFSAYGAVESVRLRGAVPPAGGGRGLKKKAVIHRDFHTQQRCLFAFVVLKSPATCAAALRELNGFQMDGRHLRVDSAASGGASFTARHSVFVGGLPYVADEEAVRRHFAACGELVNVRVVRDACGAPKGIAFVEFATEEGAVAALKKDGGEMNGRKVRVQRWIKKEAREEGKKEKVQKRADKVAIPTRVRKAEKGEYVKQVLGKRRRQRMGKRREKDEAKKMQWRKAGKEEQQETGKKKKKAHEKGTADNPKGRWRRLAPEELQAKMMGRKGREEGKGGGKNKTMKAKKKKV